MPVPPMPTMPSFVNNGWMPAYQNTGFNPMMVQWMMQMAQGNPMMMQWLQSMMGNQFQPVQTGASALVVGRTYDVSYATGTAAPNLRPVDKAISDALAAAGANPVYPLNITYTEGSNVITATIDSAQIYTGGVSAKVTIKSITPSSTSTTTTTTTTTATPATNVTLTALGTDGKIVRADSGFTYGTIGGEVGDILMEVSGNQGKIDYNGDGFKDYYVEIQAADGTVKKYYDISGAEAKAAAAAQKAISGEGDYLAIGNRDIDGDGPLDKGFIRFYQGKQTYIKQTEVDLAESARNGLSADMKKIADALDVNNGNMDGFAWDGKTVEVTLADGRKVRVVAKFIDANGDGKQTKDGDGGKMKLYIEYLS